LELTFVPCQRLRQADHAFKLPHSNAVPDNNKYNHLQSKNNTACHHSSAWRLHSRALAGASSVALAQLLVECYKLIKRQYQQKYGPAVEAAAAVADVVAAAAAAAAGAFGAKMSPVGTLPQSVWDARGF
jgi:hypothetical protein